MIGRNGEEEIGSVKRRKVREEGSRVDAKRCEINEAKDEIKDGRDHH